MRRLPRPPHWRLAALLLAALLGTAPAVAGAQSTTAAQRSLSRSLSQSMAQAGSGSSAFVLDLNSGHALFSAASTTRRMPASVEKLYTTTTALLRFGASGTLTTAVFGRGSRGPGGVWNGTLYLRGGGDPTFGSAGFDRSWYATGATIQGLAAALRRAAGITAVHGRVVGDESFFDSLRGTPATGYQRSVWVEGQLSALAYDRGFADQQGDSFQSRPALTATAQFVGALRAAGVKVPAATPVYTGRMPATSQLLATMRSPSIGTLIRLTNTPSDNFFAEMLLKGIGARFGGAGTTAAGAAVVRGELRARFGISPQLEDGSGLSRYDRTSPRQVVTLLRQMASAPVFVHSLAIAGETGTLAHEMRGTVAQDRCRGKTGTLSDVSNLVGYCSARDGHRLAFAFLMNSINPSYAHSIQNRMAETLASYNG